MEIGDSEIAGFLDGDGCIGIYRVKRRRAASWHYVLNVIFTQSRADKMKILQDIQKKHGGYMCQVKEHPRCAMAWQLRMTGAAALNLILAIRPYLRVKKVQADLAIRFMEYRLMNTGSARKGMSFKTMRLAPEHLEFYEGLRQSMRHQNRRGTSMEESI